MIFIEDDRFEFFVGDGLSVQEFKKLYGSPLRIKARRQKMPELITGWMEREKPYCVAVVTHSLS